jgi:predicted dehydrogenase/threonine dehydrogenase-like Zn-dependent dehydrogenase
MKQVLIKNSIVSVNQVPTPIAGKGQVLVQVRSSCISTGTELAGIREPDAPLWLRALKKPARIGKAIKMAATHGINHTTNIATGAYRPSRPTGYSAAGIVVGLGDVVSKFKVGDRVACAGGGFAFHAEFITVPENLCCEIPNEVGFEDASTVALGSIALQGIRRAEPTLGETFVVIGLGALGLMTIQLLKANGCDVIAIDLDKRRMGIAKLLGADVIVDGGLVDSQLNDVIRQTNGVGADGVIITAASNSDEILSSAFQMCRKKARVVLVGAVGMNINRSDIYKKELDFRISTSYGPGRYDRSYEEENNDYPVSYVRWTENRNMENYLRLINKGLVSLSSLLELKLPIDDAPLAYDALKNQTPKPILAVLNYPDESRKASHTIAYNNLSIESGKISVAVVGAGSFAKSVHIPNLLANENFLLHSVVTRSGYNAHETAKKFGAAKAATSFEEALCDDEIDAVIICTRHVQHASQALQALQAGKHVLVEKPLAMTAKELDELKAYLHNCPRGPVLFTGFNRRFSPHIAKIKSVIETKRTPMVLNYRMNVAMQPPDHWVHSSEGGGRNLGEACHIYDLFTYLTNSQCSTVSAISTSSKPEGQLSSDNFVASLSFQDGTIASLTYTSSGHRSVSKEILDIYSDGRIISLDDYRTTRFQGCDINVIADDEPSKGHKELLGGFATSIKTGNSQMPLWHQFQATEIALHVESDI